MDKYKHILTNVDSVASITKAQSNQLAFYDKLGQKAIDCINNSKAKVIICSNKLKMKDFDHKSKNIIFVDNPRLDFIKICGQYFPEESEKLPKTMIDQSVKIGSNVSIGSRNVIIDVNTIIHHNVVIYDNVHIGKNCLIKSGAVIGGDGFGYEQNITGMWIKFPHYGKVIIKDNVHIGSNTCIDRGTLSDTIIEMGVKIDNLIHIAHNVRIGKDSLIIALAMLGGGSKFGRNVLIAPSSSIRDGIEVADSSIVGLGAVVVNNIPKNSIVIGNPAKFYKKRKEQ